MITRFNADVDIGSCGCGLHSSEAISILFAVLMEVHTNESCAVSELEVCVWTWAQEIESGAVVGMQKIMLSSGLTAPQNALEYVGLADHAIFDTE